MEQTLPDNARIIQPSILYFGTAVVLLSTLNEDGSTNLTPMSSAWALGHRIVLGLGESSHGLANLSRHPERDEAKQAAHRPRLPRLERTPPSCSRSGWGGLDR